MIVIDIETEALKGMSNAANAALGELQHADSILRGVTEHHDWGCKERDQVNDHIQKARTQMTKIKNNGNQFNNTVRNVLEEFLETESGIGDMFNSLEAMLANLINVWENTIGNNSDTEQNIKLKLFPTPNGIVPMPWKPRHFKMIIGENGQLQIVDNPMSVVDYQSVLKGLEE